MDIASYDIVLFDCDGVILDSNEIKSDAFYNCALRFGKAEAQWLKEFNKENGGVSRYKKFELFARRQSPENLLGLADELISRYEREVVGKLLVCPASQTLLENVEHRGVWAVISGGDQNELRDLFSRRGLSDQFNGGIYGSPRDKFELVEEEISPMISESVRVLFVGDARLDAKVAKTFGFDFAFISAWSECSSIDIHDEIDEFCQFETLDEMILGSSLKKGAC